MCRMLGAKIKRQGYGGGTGFLDVFLELQAMVTMKPPLVTLAARLIEHIRKTDRSELASGRKADKDFPVPASAQQSPEFYFWSFQSFKLQYLAAIVSLS